MAEARGVRALGERRNHRGTVLLSLAMLVLASPGSAQDRGRDVYTTQIVPIFRKYCTACHNPEDLEGELDLESYEGLRRGGEEGAAIVPGKSDKSLLLRRVGTPGRGGMPPGKRKRPGPAEIALLRAWIDAGAAGPRSVAKPGASAGRAVPRIEPRVPPRRAIHAAAHSPRDELFALARYGEIELVSSRSRNLVRILDGVPGRVTSLDFSPDGELLAAGAGVAGVSGEARLYRVATGELLRAFRGHSDSLYAVAVSPDGRLLATGSYDHDVLLWGVETGEKLRRLSGHNGAVFDLAFRRDGKVLASASGDRTVKLWNVATGERLDTFSEPLEEVYALSFSPDGRQVVAGGADNRLRVWEISEAAAEGSNRLLLSRFAHEGTIIELVHSPDGSLLLSSADDRSVKVWNTTSLSELHLLEKQPDWAPALCFSADGRSVIVGRQDGSVAFYDPRGGRRIRLSRAARPGRRARPAASAPLGGLAVGLVAAALGAPGEAPGSEEKKKAAEKGGKKKEKPQLARSQPRSVRRGVATRVRLLGKHLAGVREVKTSSEKIAVRLLEATPPDSGGLWVEVKPEKDLGRGSHEFWVESPAGTSGKIRLHVDDLEPRPESEPNDHAARRTTTSRRPVSFLGAIDPRGDVDHFGFEARAGETVVADLQAQVLGSKLDAVLVLTDGDGRLLARSNDFDGSPDPFIAFAVPADGEYVLRVTDLTLGGSADHFYRLSVGALRYVTSVFPLSASPGTRQRVELGGHNLPEDAAVTVTVGERGETPVPLDGEIYRSRRSFRVLAGAGREVLEAEPNGRPGQANDIPVPCVAGGRIGRPGADGGIDADLFRFRSEAGRTWVIETDAARRGSPVDTRVEVLHEDGRPVERALLRATRDSYIDFRPIDANGADVRVKNWEEMELNQYLYLKGEVGKIFRMPRGPDSGILLYSLNGRRRCYFDTSATTHADEETCYIVEAHPPGTRLVPNGLPIFPLSYENDDDGYRELGRDSRLLFRVPATGHFLVRVTDVNRRGGERYVYRLVVREARPDFTVHVGGRDPKLNAGSGKEFSVSVDRRDGFEGEVRVDVSGLPEGLSASTPLVIQAGHRTAKGSLFAAPGARAPTDALLSKVKLTARAVIGGQEVVRPAGDLGKIEVHGPPELFVSLAPPAAGGAAPARSSPDAPAELVIAPGSTVPAVLKVRRNGHEELVTFSVENLPHGVIVDNIGLSGVLIPKGENERQIFLTAAAWVPETSRLCHAAAQQAGRQTSFPVWLHVRK
ncbi:MAG: pre-peptidase C-terminal domain-containing protein [Planctomycetota bacterium]|nr:pre-peptidase C-terminal domain-containing protein [Planctomycetota bacterium]